MNVKLSHLLVVGAIGAFVPAGCGATSETESVAAVATELPSEAAQQAAEANVRDALPSLEAFYAEHGTYAGADVVVLRRDYDPGLDPTVTLVWVTNGRYCLESTVDGETASMTGPGGEVELGGC